MKFIFTILCLPFLFVGCQPAADSGNEIAADENPVKEIFERNSQTVLKYLEAWQNEDVDHATFFAEDYESFGTGFGATDTIRFADMVSSDQDVWERRDFELVTDPLVLLPGVDADTKEMDGSVRYYGEWKVIAPASDSTEERSGTLSLYQTYDFNEEGKITLVLTYADFTGMTIYLDSEE